MELRCVHCHRIDGHQWGGPVPCCTLELESPVEIELETLEGWDWVFLDPNSIVWWSPHGSLERWGSFEVE